MRVVATPGYLKTVRRFAGNLVSFEPLNKALRILAEGKGEPSWVIGDPSVGKQVHDDGGRTLKISSPFKFFAIRDDHPEDCDCGCGGGTVITALLPSEY